MAEPEQKINKHLPRRAEEQGFPGPEKAPPTRPQEGLGGAGSRLLPQTTIRAQRGPLGAPCRPGSGFPRRGGTQITLWVNGSGFQVTHVNKMQNNKIEAISRAPRESSARPCIVLSYLRIGEGSQKRLGFLSRPSSSSFLQPDFRSKRDDHANSGRD